MTDQGPKLRCGIYARVSSEEQRERKTIASQLDSLPSFRESQGWADTDRYIDDGHSGETIEDRPEFMRLMADMKAGKLDVVLSIDYDRITRSQSDETRGKISDWFRKHDVYWASPSTGLRDFSDPSQRVVMGVEGTMSANEKAKFLKRTARGKRHWAKQGAFRAGIDPYGLRWVRAPEGERGGCYEIRDDEAKVVRRMFELALTVGMDTLAWTLNQEGYRTRDMKRWSRPEGGDGAWTVGTIRKMLRSTTYKGEHRVFKREDIPPMKVPPIIDLDTWNGVQQMIRIRQCKAIHEHNREYLVVGLVKCGVCGYACWAAHARKSRRQHFSYYRCSSSNNWRKLGMDGPCGSPCWRTDDVDAAVWREIQRVLQDPALLAEAASIADKPDGVDWAAQQKALQKKLAKLLRDEVEVVALRRREQISEPALRISLQEIARERGLVEGNLRVAERQLMAAGEKRALIKQLVDTATRLTSKLDCATFEERRQIVRLVVAREYGGKIVLHADHSIEIFGMLATESSRFDLQLKTRAG